MGFGYSAPRILVIDDERPVREMLTQMLERQGYEVESAENGEVAMDLLKKNPADLVITDMVMPKKEGMITIMEICRDFPELKVIAISGGGTTGWDGKAAEYLSIASRCGARRTFKKPLSREDLLTAIKELLKQP
ncbi:MAG: response regulator [Desulfatibacillum sp.]|nr:response regulator [Desulfatibacillum sp.]